MVEVRKTIGDALDGFTAFLKKRSWRSLNSDRAWCDGCGNFCSSRGTAGASPSRRRGTVIEHLPSLFPYIPSISAALTARASANPK